MRRAPIDRDHALENPPAGRVFGDTTYLTVVDRNRMAVSLITSISGPFGSGLVVPGLGVVLNNRLADFGKRLAAMGHVVVWDGPTPASPGDVGESFEGSAQAILLGAESLCGASGPRLDGIACPL